MRRSLCWGICLVAICIVLGLAPGAARAEQGTATPGDQVAAEGAPTTQSGNTSEPTQAEQSEDATLGSEQPAAAEEGTSSEQGVATEAPPEEKPPAALGQEEPEIEVEVVGKKEAEQPVPSLAPTTGEVITSINAAELEATGETNLADALEFLPGTTVTHQGRRFETFVNVRGQGTPVVLLDGALISSGIFANRILYTLPFSAIERVDVIRSSSSLLYGPQALQGGAINIVTKSGKGRTQGDYKTYAQGGTFDYTNVGAAVGQGAAGRGVYFVSDHDYANSNLEFGGHAMQRWFLKLDGSLKNGDPVKLSAMTVDGRRRFDVWDQEWQDVTGVKPAYWGLDPYRERLVTLAYAHDFARPNSGLDVELWWRGQDYHNFSFGGPIQPQPGKTVFYDEVGDIYGLNALTRLQVGQKHYLRAGVETWKLDGYTQDYVLQADGSIVAQPQEPYWSSAAGSNPAESKLTAFVAQDEWAIRPRTHFFYGGRYEWPGYGLHNMFTYALGVEHELGTQAALYGHLGTGVKYVTPADLADNPLLKDQTSLNADFGIQKRFKRLRGRVGWFQSAVDNYTISYLKEGGDPTERKDYIETQADFTRSGLEAELEGAARANPSLRYFANYTYTDQDIRRLPVDAEGRPLQLGVPAKGQFSLGVRWTSPDKLSRVALSFTHVGDVIARSGYYSEAYPLSAYQYANLTLSHQFRAGWALNAALNNIFDESYESQPGFPRPGRNFIIGIGRSGSFK